MRFVLCAATQVLNYCCLCVRVRAYVCVCHEECVCARQCACCQFVYMHTVSVLLELVRALAFVVFAKIYIACVLRSQGAHAVVGA